MPVRQVPKNYCSLTGMFVSAKSNRGIFFESSLQRDFINLLEFDTRIVAFDEQPIQIPFLGPTGRMQFYTPDFLVSYRNHEHTEPLTRCLVVVKSRSELKSKWAGFRHAYKAAIAFAAVRGWRFKILSENEIRTIYLKPARFLTRYLQWEPDPWLESLALEALAFHTRQVRKVPMVLILEDQSVRRHLAQHDRNLLQFTGQVWRLVANGRIAMDIERFYRGDVLATELWIPEDPPTPLIVPLPLPGLWRS